MQAFPADFVPHGAVAAPDDAIGKFTTTQITKGQIVLSNQLSATLRAGNLSLSVPAGMEAVALPMTDLMSSNGAIKAGDHVDILLTIDLVEIKLQSAQGAATPADAGGGGNAKNPVTQTTLQNVEVLAVGEAADDSSDSGSSATTAGSSNSTAKGAVIVSVNPQDALVLKYAKDSGGVVDLALRAPGDTQPVTTDPVTIDRLFGRFNFQRPGPLP
jgi:pilus assembly protein CpaB